MMELLCRRQGSHTDIVTHVANGNVILRRKPKTAIPALARVAATKL